MTDSVSTFSLFNTLEGALASVQALPQDAAAFAVARRYAAAIDEAGDLAAQADGLWRALPVDDAPARKQLAALEAKVSAQAVLGELGPKLVAVLVELGMTPRARAAVTAKGGGSGDGAGRSKADELRERRAARGAGQHAAAPVD
jgi:hypothetical protein